MASRSPKDAKSIVLEEVEDPTYVPSQEEVLAYAKFLGIKPEERELLWIAKEGLKAPLPAQWKTCQAVDTGAIYYFNFETEESTWDHPNDAFYRKLVEFERRKLRERNSGTVNRSAIKHQAKDPTTSTPILSIDLESRRSSRANADGLRDRQSAAPSAANRSDFLNARSTSSSPPAPRRAIRTSDMRRSVDATLLPNTLSHPENARSVSNDTRNSSGETTPKSSPEAKRYRWTIKDMLDKTKNDQITLKRAQLAERRKTLLSEASASLSSTQADPPASLRSNVHSSESTTPLAGSQNAQYTPHSAATKRSPEPIITDKAHSPAPVHHKASPVGIEHNLLATSSPTMNSNVRSQSVPSPAPSIDSLKPVQGTASANSCEQPPQRVDALTVLERRLEQEAKRLEEIKNFLKSQFAEFQQSQRKMRLQQEEKPTDGGDTTKPAADKYANEMPLRQLEESQKRAEKNEQKLHWVAEKLRQRTQQRIEQSKHRTTDAKLSQTVNSESEKTCDTPQSGLPNDDLAKVLKKLEKMEADIAKLAEVVQRTSHYDEVADANAALPIADDCGENLSKRHIRLPRSSRWKYEMAHCRNHKIPGRYHKRLQFSMPDGRYEYRTPTPPPLYRHATGNLDLQYRSRQFQRQLAQWKEEHVAAREQLWKHSLWLKSLKDQVWTSPLLE